ncbi:hypothetical protein HBI56_117790 [Parastagonospora nodorum]|nr:hypothetical protein HBI56_117790 [Parastagonospora nodorum]
MCNLRALLVRSTNSLRARTLINLSAVLLRARTLINSSAVLYKQSAAQLSLPAEISNIDLNFVPSVAFIPNVYIANSLRARTLINLSAPACKNTNQPICSSVRAGNLPDNADRVNNNNNNIAPTLQFSLTALLNLQSLALKRPTSSSSDLNCKPSLAKQIKTNKNCKKSTHCQGFNSSSSLKDNIEKLIYVSKVKHTYVQAHTVPYPNPKKYLSNSTENNRNNLNIIVTNPTSREFSRVDMKSLTRLYLLIDRTNIRRKQASKSPLGLPFLELISITLYKFYKSKNIQLELGSIYVLRIISKLDKVPTQELSSHIKTELYLLRNNSRKFYHLVITSKDTHYKQTIKKAYIILLERASLILFIT